MCVKDKMFALLKFLPCMCATEGGLWWEEIKPLGNLGFIKMLKHFTDEYKHFRN